MIPKRNFGLTLIEILISISIIIIISTLIGLVAHNAVASSKRTASLSNLSQIGKANSLYMGDHDSYYPPYSTLFFNANFVPEYSGQQPAERWRDCLMPYIKSKEIFFSPLDPYAGTPQNESTVPSGLIRGVTSYVHDSRFEVALSTSNSTLSSSSINPETIPWFMHESSKAFLSTPNSSLTTEVPIAGDSIGVLFHDGSIKRLPWKNPLD